MYHSPVNVSDTDSTYTMVPYVIWCKVVVFGEGPPDHRQMFHSSCRSLWRALAGLYTVTRIYTRRRRCLSSHTKESIVSERTAASADVPQRFSSIVVFERGRVNDVYSVFFCRRIRNLLRLNIRVSVFPRITVHCI